MTDTLLEGGRFLLSVKDGAGEREAALIERLVGMVLALEPLELKQGDAADTAADMETDLAAGMGADEGAHGAPAARDDPVAPTLVTESTQRMLAQMRAVLDREAARLGADGAEGKAAVDQVSLIARTLEKIDQMERLIAENQARTAQRTLNPDEREQLRQTVRQLILAAADRLALERESEQAASEGGRDVGGQGIQGQDFSERTEVETE